ncbi:hypothetical protein D3C86_1272800 [compost metagenome]
MLLWLELTKRAALYLEARDVCNGFVTAETRRSRLTQQTGDVVIDLTHVSLVVHRLGGYTQDRDKQVTDGDVVFVDLDVVEGRHNASSGHVVTTVVLTTFLLDQGDHQMHLLDDVSEGFLCTAQRTSHRTTSHDVTQHGVPHCSHLGVDRVNALSFTFSKVCLHCWSQ